MKIDRGEVEELLAMLEQVHKPNNGTFAELCRTWLAVQDAPTIEVDDADVEFWPILDGMRGQRVRLVRDGGE